ncbi:MAG: hypothetical protein WBZ32_11610, partial [Candidatus Acidiferrales bacterium]
HQHSHFAHDLLLPDLRPCITRRVIFTLNRAGSKVCVSGQALSRSPMPQGINIDCRMQVSGVPFRISSANTKRKLDLFIIEQTLFFASSTMLSSTDSLRSVLGGNFLPLHAFGGIPYAIFNDSPDCVRQCFGVN